MKFIEGLNCCEDIGLKPEELWVFNSNSKYLELSFSKAVKESFKFIIMFMDIHQKMIFKYSLFSSKIFLLMYFKKNARSMITSD